MVRSTASGRPLSDVMVVEVLVLASPGMSLTRTVAWELAARLRLCVTTAPDSVKKVSVTGAAAVFGLAREMSSLQNVPVAPSAR
jgi:hypothetical protein